MGVLLRHHLNHIFYFKHCKILQNCAYLTFISAAGTYFDLFQHHLVLVGLVHLEEIGIGLSGKYQLVVGCWIDTSKKDSDWELLVLSVCTHQNFEPGPFVLRLFLLLLAWVVRVEVDHLVLRIEI